MALAHYLPFIQHHDIKPNLVGELRRRYPDAGVHMGDIF
jgi:hypothetical protein